AAPVARARPTSRRDITGHACSEGNQGRQLTPDMTIPSGEHELRGRHPPVGQQLPERARSGRAIEGERAELCGGAGLAATPSQRIGEVPLPIQSDEGPVLCVLTFVLERLRSPFDLDPLTLDV